MPQFQEMSVKIGKETVKCAHEIRNGNAHPMMKLADGRIHPLQSGSKPEMAEDKGASPASMADVKAAFVAGTMVAKGISEAEASALFDEQQGIAPPPKPVAPAAPPAPKGK